MGRLIPFRLGSISLSLSSIKEVLEFSAPLVSPAFQDFRDVNSKSSKLTSTNLDALEPPTQLESRPVPVTELIIFPEDQEEWMVVMEEVKTLYIKRQYKQCSARCIQILDNIKNPIIARALHINSSDKLTLFQQALSHYQIAESQIEYASFSADPRVKAAAYRRRPASITSSVRSSIDSVFSHTSSINSACSSALPSPTSPCTTPEKPDLNPFVARLQSEISQPELAPSPLNIKKKVCFSFDPRRVSLTKSNLENAGLLDHFPSPPTSPSPTQMHFASFEEREESPNSIKDFLLSRSLARYRAHLSDLQNQLNHHIGSVKAQMLLLNIQRKARRSNLPNLFHELGSGCMEGVDKEEIRKVELEARITRLKAAGWQRKRFDGERYNNLCDTVLRELA